MPQPKSLSEAWKEESLRWAEWARKPGHDTYWKFHRDQFLELLPPAASLTVDVGCGEGRLCRDLQKLGHKVCGLDVSELLIDLARLEDPQGDYRVANAARIPLADECTELVVSFMCLHDVDELQAAVSEIARILKPGGKAAVAIVHPINSSGRFADDGNAPNFIMDNSYLDESQYAFPIERDGLSLTFHSAHRPIESFSRAFERAGLLIQAIRERKVPDSFVTEEPEYKKWQRVPMFLHMLLVKP